jgi:peptidoglycan/xylan/chitin deacetylase (PgdA/CDA1 family)
MIVGLLMLWVAVTTYGSYDIGLNWYLNSRKTVERGAIALTFDDGPDPVRTPQVLAILRDSGVVATFFLIGEKAEKHPEIVESILRHGHAIGNHSYSHSYQIGFYSTRRLEADLRRCKILLEKLTQREVPLFRPPFGVTNPRYRTVLDRLNLISVGWSLRSYDTVIREEGKLMDRLARKIQPGDIVLMHDTAEQTVSVLPEFIRLCQARQLGFVAIS